MWTFVSFKTRDTYQAHDITLRAKSLMKIVFSSYFLPHAFWTASVFLLKVNVKMLCKYLFKGGEGITFRTPPYKNVHGGGDTFLVDCF